MLGRGEVAVVVVVDVLYGWRLRLPIRSPEKGLQRATEGIRTSKTLAAQRIHLAASHSRRRPPGLPRTQKEVRCRTEKKENCYSVELQVKPVDLTL